MWAVFWLFVFQLQNKFHVISGWFLLIPLPLAAAVFGCASWIKKQVNSKNVETIGRIVAVFMFFYGVYVVYMVMRLLSGNNASRMVQLRRRNVAVFLLLGDILMYSLLGVELETKFEKPRYQGF
jgi:uncharacterized membrane protein